MIDFHHEIEFGFYDEQLVKRWFEELAKRHGKTTGEISVVFCDDAFLFELNVKFLNHDTLTDIITFDYTTGNEISGEMFISVERVRENALELSASFEEELLRVLAHGVLHLCGFKDKSEADEREMRLQEDVAIKLFHVEHQ